MKHLVVRIYFDHKNSTFYPTKEQKQKFPTGWIVPNYLEDKDEIFGVFDTEEEANKALARAIRECAGSITVPLEDDIDVDKYFASREYRHKLEQHENSF